MNKKQNPFVVKGFEAFRNFMKSFWWSCRESNPGPDKEAICFLHV